MLTIRLYPMGRKHKKVYRVVLAEKKFAVCKQFIENLGHYNPHTKEIKLNKERIQHWLSLNTETSDTVLRLFKLEGIVAK
jgi:small subunit ribosomal protein S16